MDNTTAQTTGKGECALRDNWSTYVSLLKADLKEQEAIVSGFLVRSGKGELSLNELKACTNASGRVSSLRNLLRLIGESDKERKRKKVEALQKTITRAWRSNYLSLR